MDESTAPDGQPTISLSGVAPKSMLPKADDARSILSGLIEADLPDSQQRTAIQAMIDGAPMFTDAQLKAANQGFRSRVNWGGARSRIRDYLTAFHDLVTSPDTLPSVRLRDGDPIQRQAWGQIFSEEFQHTLFETYDDWSFLYHSELHHKQLAIHGIGPCFWRDNRDWRFHALKRRNILVPKDSPSDVSRIPMVFIRDSMYVDELFKYIRVKGKANTRWNQKAVIDAIRNAQPEGVRDKFTWENAQERWQNNAYGWGRTESKVVNVAHAFVKEFDGTVSHHILTETAQDGQKAEDKDSGYLYSDIGTYQNMNQAVWICFQDVGNGDFHSVRGLGLEAFHFGEAQNRLNNSLIDNAIAGSAIMLRSDTPEHANKLTRIEIGPYRMLPSGVTFEQVNMGAAVNSTLAVASHFSEMELAGGGTYRTRATQPSGQARTATEVSAEIGETSKLNNASVSHYCSQGDAMLAESFRRLTRETILDSDPGGLSANEFKRRCVERGIPWELFHDLAAKAKVTMSRPVGNGSYADRIARLRGIGQYIGDMPDRKRRQYVRDVIAQTGGDRELAERYGPDTEQQFPGIEYTLAILENNGFEGGGTQDPFSPDNAHTVHFPVHYKLAMKAAQEPQESVRLLGTPDEPGPLYIHLKQHVAALSGDPTHIMEFKEFTAAVGSLENVMKKNSRMQEIEAQNAPAEGPTPEEMKVQMEGQIKAQSAQADAEVKAFKAKQQAALKDATEAQKLRHREAEHQQKMAANRQAMEMAADKPEPK